MQTSRMLCCPTDNGGHCPCCLMCNISMSCSQVLLYNKRSVRGDALIGLSSVALGAITAAAVDGAAMVRSNFLFCLFR